MIRQVLICGLRSVLLAGLTQAPLAGCASDGHYSFPKPELSGLRQPDWWPWKDRNRTPHSRATVSQQHDPASVPPAPVPVLATLPAPARGTSRDAPGTLPAAGTRNRLQAPPSLQSRNTPRPRPARSTTRVALPADEPVVAKVPQGKVVQEKLPEIVPAAGTAANSMATRYAVKDLIGLKGQAVEHLLGKPDLSHQEDSAEIWQYTHGDCILFLVFHPSDEGGPEVARAEVSARNGGKGPDPARCIRAVAARNPAAPG